MDHKARKDVRVFVRKKNVSEKDSNVSSKRKYKNIFMQVCFPILCTNFFERLAYYALTNSLTIFFTNVCILI